jgi:hypothetical protein
MLFFILNKYLFYIILTITLYFSIPPLVFSQSKFEDVIDVNNEIQSTINSKFSFYNNKFKEIQFVHLKGGNHWKEELKSILKQLGENAVALDYEHPKKLQQDLMFVTIERLKFMLEHDGFSSTLFRVGGKNYNKKRNICVITLNPKTVGMSKADALRYMIDYSDEKFKEIHPSRYLDTINFIKFSIDHEVFHCLDSFLYGGAPLTFEVLGGDYNQIKRESAADAFAMSMHLKKHGTLTSFSRNLVHIRALSIKNNSLNHNTLRTVLKVMRTKNAQINNMSIKDIIIFSKHLSDETVGSYHDFKKQYALEIKALNKLGCKSMLSKEKLDELNIIAVDPVKVEKLVKQSRYFYQKLFSNTLIDLKIYPQD